MSEVPDDEPTNDENAKAIGNALDDFFGQWSEEEAAALRESQKPFEQIDEEFWK